MARTYERPDMRITHNLFELDADAMYALMAMNGIGLPRINV